MDIFYYNIPKWHREDEWLPVEALDFSSAAENACMERDESYDYEIVSTGGLKEILVKDSDEVIKRFEIEAYAEPVYEAYEL